MSEVENFIKKTLKTSHPAPAFTLIDLKQMFLKAYQHYTGTSVDFHSTRLKEKLISEIRGLLATQVIPTTGKVTTEALLAVLSYRDDDGDKALVRAAKLIRQDLFNNENEFKFNFDKDSQKNFVPKRLIMLLQTILERTNISLLDDDKTRDIVLVFPSFLNLMPLNESGWQIVLHVRHKNFQETPLTVYIGLYIHSKTRKKV